MYRPTPVEYFSRLIEARLPIGPATAVIKIGEYNILKKAIIKVYPAHAGTWKVSTIEIK